MVAIATGSCTFCGAGVTSSIALPGQRKRICTSCQARLGHLLERALAPVTQQVWRGIRVPLAAPEAKATADNWAEDDYTAQFFRAQIFETNNLNAENEWSPPSEDAFKNLRQNVRKLVQAGDVETHLDLGMAYDEMGLYADALGEMGHVLRDGAGTKWAEQALTRFFQPKRLHEGGLDRLRELLFPA
jgi:hypothetical protein